MISGFYTGDFINISAFTSGTLSTTTSGGNTIATVTSGTSYSDATLSAASSYSYQVAAFDKAAAPNVSALSAPFGVNTGTTLTLTPANAALTLLQTQQFSANAPVGTILNWSVDNLAGGVFDLTTA